MKDYYFLGKSKSKDPIGSIFIGDKHGLTINQITYKDELILIGTLEEAALVFMNTFLEKRYAFLNK